MKTNGATWKAYLESWPDGQWFDDCDETINGVPGDEFGLDTPDDAVVEFTCGVVFANENDRAGESLVAHFKRWQKAQTHDTIVISIPKDKQDELKAFLCGVGGSMKD